MPNITPDQWSQILHKSVLEREFHDRILRDPKSAARSLNIELDAADVAKLQEMVKSLDQQDLNHLLNRSDPVDLQKKIDQVAHVTHNPGTPQGPKP
jgi:hypothetical protein